MYISEIIIDGFKSYASRTVLSGFDESFNAITGLNGSGKSNILDAICFVLGISNLSQVRVTNLQELVYKQGQAGVTKASVSVVFDNSDRTRSPPGYEEYSHITVTRQVVIGGRNKYLINGQTAQLNRVQNLFHSVQLNVNNPHFLIMQGRITKVLNMKPPEILGMIEEAAGTRMYEMKKSNAHKTMEKKDKKLEEIQKILAEEIVPTLERLKQDRERYVQWSTLREKCEEMERYCIAYQYHSSARGTKQHQIKVKELAAKVKQLEEESQEAEAEEQQVVEQIEELKRKKKSRKSNSGEDFEKQSVELSKELVKKDSIAQHKRQEYESEKLKLATLEKQIIQDGEEVERVREEAEKSQKEYEKIKQETDQLAQKVASLQEQHESVTAGVQVADTDDGEGTVTERLIERKRVQAQLSTELEKTQLKLKHLTSSLEEKRKTLSKATKQDDEMKRYAELRSSELEKLTQQKEGLGFNIKDYQQAEIESNRHESTISKLEQEISKLSSELASTLFTYDKKVVSSESVYGLVAELINIKDPLSTCFALEVAGSGKLYQLVIDTEITGQKIISEGKPSRRITVIPLNNIRYTEIPESVIKRAEKMNSRPALTLIEYEPNFEPAMKFVFGKTLVCDDLNQAEQVAFHPEVMTRTVTLQGDVFDPSGTLTGGSRRTDSKNSTLAKFDRLKILKEQIDEERSVLDVVKERMNSKLLEEFNSISSKCELKKHELTLVLNRQEQSSNSQIRRECEQIEKELLQLKERIPILKQEMNENDEKISDLEKQIEDSNKNSTSDKKQEQLERIEKNQKQLKLKLQSHKSKTREIEQKSQKLNLQIEEMESENKESINKCEMIKKSLKKLLIECEKLEKEFEEFEEEYLQVKQRAEEQQSQRIRSDQQISDLNLQKERLTKRKTDLLIEIRKIEQDVEIENKNSSQCERMISKLEQENSWIKNEKNQFGKSNSIYDFSKSESLEDARQKLTNLTNEQNKASKTVNKKVMAMYDKADKEYRDLIGRRSIVESDKQKIEQVIVELDDKKKEAIKKTWSKVNTDFSSIFSTLLPGACGKLDTWREDGNTNNDDIEGLEVRVGFGQVWKQSLTELSGGQKSLLALSLILALLLFKPAPMYILDEIDAALDPSHTQNIGRMLKTHFTNSQFIVVSLKEGMFQNANVLFRTKFVNGQSTVARIASHRSAITSNSNDMDEDTVVDKENNVPRSSSSSSKGNEVDHSVENRKALAAVNKSRKRTRIV